MKPLTIMVSSTVYGIEELLERIYTVLTLFGYEVWMSHKGTVPLRSDRSAFENCLAAVEQADLFLSLITPQYGSGKDGKNELSITHQELLKAIELNKPRWVLAHDHVVFAKSFLRQLGYKTQEDRKKLDFKPGQVFADLRVIDMYEAAIASESQTPPSQRAGNWVQKYSDPGDAQLFASAQFSRYQEVEAFIQENLNPQSLKLPQAKTSKSKPTRRGKK
jgi:hypothetical protein